MTIALLGLPGAGKSTLARAMADQLKAVALLEPEERDWPDYVRHPHPNGAFTRLSWFRTQRVPLYYKAQSVQAVGGLAILDSYYDKWCIGWLGTPGLEWLIGPNDKYFAVAQDVARIDAKVLPKADIVILLEIEKALWREQLAARGREIDKDDPFLRSHHSQDQIVSTALERGPMDGTTVIRHQRQRTSPEVEAAELCKALGDLNVDLQTREDPPMQK